VLDRLVEDVAVNLRFEKVQGISHRLVTLLSANLEAARTRRLRTTMKEISTYVFERRMRSHVLVGLLVLRIQNSTSQVQTHYKASTLNLLSAGVSQYHLKQANGQRLAVTVQVTLSNKQSMLLYTAFEALVSKFNSAKLRDRFRDGVAKAMVRGFTRA
jgi:hypothetical protein